MPFLSLLRAVLLVGCLVGLGARPAAAATYTFPGSLPAGCVLGVAGVYTCGTVNLGAADTVNITGSAVITFTGGFSIQGSQINAGGSAANLTLNVGGTFSASAGGRVVGNINAAGVSTTGAQTYTGNIAVTAALGTLSLGTGTTVNGNVSTVNGSLTIGTSDTINGNLSSTGGAIYVGGQATVTGSVTSTSGLVSLTSGVSGTPTTVGSILTGGGADVHSYSHVLGTTQGSYVSGGSYPQFDGAITATSTYVSFGDHATVTGNIVAASYVYTGLYGSINGSITSGTLQIDLAGHTTVTGSLTANGTYVNFGIGSSAGGAVWAKTYVDLGSGGSVGGSVTSQTSYVNGDSLTVTGAITASTIVDVHSNGTFGGSITAGGDISIYNSNTVVGDVSSSGGHVFINDYDNITGNISAQGYVSIDDYTVINGDVTSTGSYVYISSHSTINGNVTASTTMTMLSTSSIRQCARSTTSGTMHLYSSSVGGGCCGAVGTCGKSCLHDTVPPDCQTLHHMKVTTPAASGNNCSTNTATLTACADATCATNYTWGVTGNLTASGTGMTVTYPSGSGFSIPYGSASTSSGVVFQTTDTGTLTLGATASSPTAAASTTCSLGGGSTCSYPISTTGCSVLHHLQVETASNTGLTCNTTTATVRACGDATCSTAYTAGVTGTLTASGAGQTVNFPSGASFSIASGSSTATVVFQQTTVGTITLGATSSAPAASNATTCLLGASTSCSYSNASSAFVFNPGGGTVSLQSGTTRSLQIQAVRASDSSPNTCVAGLTGTQTVRFSCAYVDPPASASSATVNTLPLMIGSTGLNASGSTGSACDGSSQAVSLTFDSNGLATISNLGYDDVGSLTLSGSYTGSGSTAGLSLSGSATVKAAPTSFGISGVTSGPIKAGAAFSATVTAYNAKNAVVKNFGQESAAEGVRLSWTQKSPVGTASDGVTAFHTGVLTGSGVSATLTGFSSGAKTVSDLRMDEAGYGDLTATLASGNYLSSGYTASGTTGSSGAVGRFIPNQYEVLVTGQGCGSFTYSGQPFAVQVTAQNASGARTYNYDGNSWANAATLSATGAAGSLTAGQSLAASDFKVGRATTTAPAFTFTSPLTGPSSAASVVATSTISGATVTGSSTPSAASLALRSGRLRITNKFGSERTNAVMPVQVQYYNSNGLWVINADDNCTKVPVSAVVLDNYLDAHGVATSSWSTSVVSTAGGYAIESASGNGTLALRPPQPQPATTAGPWYTGTVDVAINLGSSSTDRSCLHTPRPTTSTGASLSWLRSQYGSKYGCTGAATYDHDPSARATFGVYAPEATRTVHQIEVP